MTYGCHGKAHLRALDEFLHPFDADTFLSQHFEQSPLHIETGKVALPISPVDIDVLINVISISQPSRLRANKGGRVLDPPKTSSPAELCQWLYDSYAEGATIVINYAECFDSRCRQFSAWLGAAIGAGIALTIFITPPNSQGFSPHFDTLDVFVLQASGQKHWCLGAEALFLPTLRQGYLVDEGQFGEARRLVSMHEGDILYIPRGVVHWASSAAEASVHVTAEVISATASDLMRMALLKSNTIASKLSYDGHIRGSSGVKLSRDFDELKSFLETISQAEVEAAVRQKQLTQYG